MQRPPICDLSVQVSVSCGRVVSDARSSLRLSRRSKYETGNPTPKESRQEERWQLRSYARRVVKAVKFEKTMLIERVKLAQFYRQPFLKLLYNRNPLTMQQRVQLGYHLGYSSWALIQCSSHLPRELQLRVRQLGTERRMPVSLLR